jgi:hypothetical protein
MTKEDFTIVPLPLWFVLIVTVLFGCPSNALAEPLFQASDQKARITLYSDQCELKEVSNLSRKATWEESGKTFEGCWSISPLGVVVMYFSDKTVAVAPAQAFQKVTGV